MTGWPTAWAGEPSTDGAASSRSAPATAWRPSAGPIFLPTLVLAFAHSPLTGLAALAVYSLAVAGFVLLAAGLVAGGHHTRLRAILARTALVTKVSAALLVVAGVWLLWFDWQAGTIG